MTYVIIGLVVIVLGAVIFLLRFGRKAGSDAIAADVAEETVDKLRKAGEAQVNAPKSKPDVVKRLREKGL